MTFLSQLVVHLRVTLVYVVFADGDPWRTSFCCMGDSLARHIQIVKRARTFRQR